MRRLPTAPPWTPLAATWATLFLGPLAGALVTAANLNRLGRRDKALFALLAGVATLLALGGLWAANLATGERGLLAYGVLSAGNIGLFLYLQYDDFRQWTTAHPRDAPLTAWAAAPWALIGFALMLSCLLVWLTAVTFALIAQGGV
jgi:hypothetical protein